MTRDKLNEEKRELQFKLLDIIAELERVRGYQVAIKDIIPVLKGLKVVYSIATDRVRYWSRIIKYSDLANEN